MKESSRFLVKIKVSDKVFHINGKVIRSPLHAIVTEDELKIVKVTIRSLGLMERDYTIEPYKEEFRHTSIRLEELKPIEDLPDNDVAVEELEETSTLNSLLKE